MLGEIGVWVQATSDTHGLRGTGFREFVETAFEILASVLCALIPLMGSEIWRGIASIRRSMNSLYASVHPLMLTVYVIRVRVRITF